MDDYVTFLAGIFRSVRFGASSAHGVANMIRFNFFEQAGAFSRDESSGTYRVNVPEFEQAVRDLSQRILTLQGDGDYAGVDALVAEMGQVGPQLQADRTGWRRPPSRWTSSSSRAPRCWACNGVAAA
jgi:hypothetical protein